MFITRKSVVNQHATFTKAQLHRVLGHASPKVISYVNRNNITIDKSITTPTTIEYKTYSLAKATKVIS